MVNTHVEPPSSKHEGENMKEVVFSCSATGKPAPTIQWAYSSGASPLKEPQTATVANSDQTFTSSSSVTLQVPSHWSGHVDCLLNSGMVGERQERIPFSSDQTHEGGTEEGMLTLNSTSTR